MCEIEILISWFIRFQILKILIFEIQDRRSKVGRISNFAVLIAILYARKLRPIVCVRLKVSELNWPGEIKKYRNFDIDDFQDFENQDFR